MSEWITDRKPTDADSDKSGLVIIWCYNKAFPIHWTFVNEGDKWKPMDTSVTDIKLEPKQWKPDYRQPYYCIDGDAIVYRDIYEDRQFDIAKYNFGNCFQTRAQAIEAARRVRETLLNYHKELSND